MLSKRAIIPHPKKLFETPIRISFSPEVNLTGNWEFSIEILPSGYFPEIIAIKILINISKSVIHKYPYLITKA
jgi:hypothetical protein